MACFRALLSSRGAIEQQSCGHMLADVNFTLEKDRNPLLGS